MKINKIKQNTIIFQQFQLSEIEIKEIEKEKKKYKTNKAVSIEALKIVQKYRGWISTNSIHAISKILNISSNEIEEVATFYSQIFRKPVGNYIIRYCDSIVCYINNVQKIKSCLEEILKIKSGETTKNKRFTLLPTCCLGFCDKSPVISINSYYYPQVTVESIIFILEQYS
ncbi:NADH-quinone oxidoreductase subunit E [Buchnera aphidicola (Anoecia corni)]|uniref:NADH-quinone oxidoreductase subunit E n=1 Tax=Buchnera aphidicola (Anoecia corni) TaxID=2994477 RepID=A0AAT9IHV9_9GAMM